MTIGELFAPIPVEKALTDVQISDITREIGRVKRGCVFVCIRGHKADGHKLAARALALGAAALVTEEPLPYPNQIVVPDTRAAYAALCAAFFGHPARRLRLIGVTGTNGKTTTTFMLKSILERSGYTCGMIGTIEYQSGRGSYEALNTTPDAYDLHRLLADMVSNGCDFAVMEVSSHALAQGRVLGLHYEVAVFTNLTQDHLDYHGTMESYFEAKQKLFRVTDTAVLNAADPYSIRMTDGAICRRVTFSAAGEADFWAKNITCRPDGATFELVSGSISGRVSLRVPGRFSVENALGAAAAALSLGLPFASVLKALSAFPGVKGRMEVLETGRDFAVIIDYAHTPDGLRKVCDAIKDTKPARLTVLFGCGGDRDRSKRPPMAAAVMERADRIVITSDNPRTEDPAAIIEDILAGAEGYHTPYTVIENRAEAIHFAIHTAQPGEVILLAGKGHETYQILKTGKIHFDEREIVAQALAELP